MKEAFRRGLLINCTHDHILRLLPPFIIRKQDVAEFLEKLEAALLVVQKASKGRAGEIKAGKGAPLALAVAN